MLDRALGPRLEPLAAAGAHPQAGLFAAGHNAAVAGKAETAGGDNACGRRHCSQARAQRRPHGSVAHLCGGAFPTHRCDSSDPEASAGRGACCAAADAAHQAGGVLTQTRSPSRTHSGTGARACTPCFAGRVAHTNIGKLAFSRGLSRISVFKVEFDFYAGFWFWDCC